MSFGTGATPSFPPKVALQLQKARRAICPARPALYGAGPGAESDCRPGPRGFEASHLTRTGREMCRGLRVLVTEMLVEKKGLVEKCGLKSWRKRKVPNVQSHLTMELLLLFGFLFAARGGSSDLGGGWIFLDGLSCFEVGVSVWVCLFV